MTLTNHTFNILIADDIPTNVRMAASILDKEGYQLSFATDGKSVLEQAKSDDFDLILLDIMMPGMDGFEVCRQLKADPGTENVPVIFLTARADTESIVTGFRIGGEDYITKPFDEEELLARVKTHLKLKRTQERLKHAYEEVEQQVKVRTRELKTALTSLVESEKRYRTLVENLPLGVFRTTLEGQFVSANPSMAAMTGFESVSELSGRHASELYVELRDRERVLNLLDRKGKITSHEVRWKRKDGTKFWVSLNATKISDSEGTHYIDGIVEDITERKRAEAENRKLEAQLRQTQKLEAIGTLAAGIAHDFNNILSSVLGYAELSLMSLDRDGDMTDMRKNLNQILKSGLRARDLTHQILTFGRQTEICRRPIKISPLIKESLKFLRASLPVTIEIRQNITVSKDTVNADPTQIHQILMNLCTNAAHAMKDKGGVLDVRLESVEIGNETVIGHENPKPGQYLRLIVSDTGHGIAKNNLDRIFDPFFTTKERGEGTGLGLSIVHGIVEDMGGTISVYSELGKGTSFHICLPILETDMIDSPMSVSLPKKGSGRILFADDEVSITKMGVHVLGMLGYEVTPAYGGPEAIEIFEKNPDAFDLVITDLTMPKMTGIELSKRLTAIRPDIPIVLCTGFMASITPEIIKDTGIREVVIKPVIASVLAKAIETALHSEKPDIRSEGKTK